MEGIAATFEMTPQQLVAVRQLNGERPMPMSALATALGCDASNVTAIVDRLESRGFLERRSSANDRRVKVLVMTPTGLDLQARIVETMRRLPPPVIANLDLDDQRALCAVLERALATLDRPTS